MKGFEYADKEFGPRDLAITLSSWLFGVGILSLPRAVAEATRSVDGWMSFVITGLAAMLFSWVAAKLAVRFPNETFYSYTGKITGKPVSFLFTLFFALMFLATPAFLTRSIADISQHYLFEHTPVEVIALLFLLVVTYAAAGSSIAVIRLNLLFFPIVLVILMLMLLLNINIFDAQRIRPLFVTPWKQILKGAWETLYAFGGPELILFYTAYMNRPKKAPRAALAGIALPTVLYALIYLFLIGTLSNEVTAHLNYPTIELAKNVEVPGEFFERFESVFFTIWVMTIFNSAAITYSLSYVAAASLFRGLSKRAWICSSAPLIYLLAMMPQNQTQAAKLSRLLFLVFYGVSFFLPVILLAVAAIRGVKGNDSK